MLDYEAWPIQRRLFTSLFQPWEALRPTLAEMLEADKKAPRTPVLLGNLAVRDLWLRTLE